MYSIFIQYANDGEGMQIGLDYRQYLLHRKFTPFLAGRGSPDIIVGYREYWTLIERTLRESNVIVSIVTNGYASSSGVRRENKYIDALDNIPEIVPFIKNQIKTPRRLKKYEIQNMRFTMNNYKELFCDLTIEIYRLMHLKHCRSMYKAQHDLNME
ncbi:MAG: hypothetical protein ACTSQY_05370 [Candidatus Odinarchaeia archaeon]